MRMLSFILALSLVFGFASAAVSPAPPRGAVEIVQVQAQESELRAAVLPSLRIETCAECELEAEQIAAWKRTYAEAALEAGYDIDLLVSAPVRVVEIGSLPNGAPYVVGETAGMRFRVGDPDPGVTLGDALGRMTYVIFTNAWHSLRQQRR